MRVPVLNATADALRRRSPALLAELEARFPGIGLTVIPKRPLGEHSDTGPQRLSELGDILLREARGDLSELIKVLSARARRISLVRVGTGAASAFASASLVGLLLSNRSGQLVAAMVALLAALGNLLITYVDDFSGGPGSTSKLRGTLTELTRQLTTAEGLCRLAKVTDDEQALLQAITQINQIFGEIQAMRALLGLSVQ